MLWFCGCKDHPIAVMKSISCLRACMFRCSVTQSCPTLCHPMDCRPPGCSVHGIFQADYRQWVAISFSNPMYLYVITNNCNYIYIYIHTHTHNFLYNLYFYLLISLKFLRQCTEITGCMILCLKEF